jgi:hypothetical protein
MTSRAERDRENVAESLRRHGFTPAEVEAWFVAEAEMAKREADKRRANRKPVEHETLFDF